MVAPLVFFRQTHVFLANSTIYEWWTLVLQTWCIYLDQITPSCCICSLFSLVIMMFEYGYLAGINVRPILRINKTDIILIRCLSSFEFCLFIRFNWHLVTSIAWGFAKFRRCISKNNEQATSHKLEQNTGSKTWLKKYKRKI